MKTEYTVETLSIPDESGWSVESNCSDIQFTNYGTANLIVNNGIVLLSGEWINIAGNTNELDKTKYIAQYSGPGTRNAIVMRRNYK
jgi:hypothetical protein